MRSLGNNNKGLENKVHGTLLQTLNMTSAKIGVLEDFDKVSFLLKNILYFAFI